MESVDPFKSYFLWLANRIMGLREKSVWGFRLKFLTQTLDFRLSITIFIQLFSQLGQPLNTHPLSPVGRG
jgi:hypothetical protein